MIANIVRSGRISKKMVFTVQKEVGKRMAAKAGSSDYSSFSLVCQSRCDVVLKGELKSGSFYPRPAVQSIIVEMTPHGRFNPGNEETYYQLIDDLFLARRKKLSNNISRGRIASLIGKDAVLSALEASGISGGLRAEMLAVEDVEKLSRLLSGN
jgi:16S rRNA (adenine1518-N6/adenine1519-N6)-dimethyltransferase